MRFLIFIGKFFALFVPLIKILNSVKLRIYTGYVSKDFDYIGHDSLVVPYFKELTGAKYISIGNKCILYSGIILTAYDRYNDQNFHPSIKIGNSVSLGFRNHITCINSIIIGNNVLTGPDVLITDNSHGAFKYSELIEKPLDRNLISKGSVIIEDDVWIGEKSSVLPGVRIGKGSIVACNSVVTKDVPAYSLVAGIPAIVVKRINTFEQ